MVLNLHFLGSVQFFFLRERGRDVERKGEKHQLVAPHVCPNPGMRPDWESILWPFHFAGRCPTK